MASTFGGKPGSSEGKGNVPPEKMSAYERWVLPNMETPQEREEFAIGAQFRHKDSQVLAVPAVEETVAPLTAEDVEAIRQAAFEEGYAEGKERGYNEGKEQGLQQGHDEGYKSGQDEVRSISLRLSQICRTLLEPIPANDEKLEDALKHLVTTICTHVVRRELMLDSSGIGIVVKEALDCMQPGAKRIRVHLNPADIDVVERELRELNQWESQWRLLAHRTITPGGCIIDSDDSIVDVRAEKRLAALLQQVYAKDATALEHEAAPRDSLAQVFSEVPAFAGDDTEASADDVSATVNTPPPTLNNEASGETTRETRAASTDDSPTGNADIDAGDSQPSNSQPGAAAKNAEPE